MIRWTFPILMLFAGPLAAQDADRDWLRPEPQTIYVDAQGDDSADGLTAETAVSTLQHAKSLLRDGVGDRLLLERGDVWTDETFGEWEISGRSPEEPLVIAAWGEGPKPLIKHGTQEAISYWRDRDDPPSYLTVRDIHFYGHVQDPDSADFDPTQTGGIDEAIRCRSNGAGLTIENCTFDYVCVTVHDADGRFRDFVFRNNVVFGHYSTSSHAQGVYVNNADGVLIEGNLFYRNGWNPDVEGAERTLFNHGVYFSSSNTGVIVRSNVFADNSMYGVKGESGGVIEGNVYTDNNNHLSYLPRYDGEHRVSGNLFMGAVDWRSGPTRGVHISEALFPAIVRDNTFVGDKLGHGVSVDDNVGPVRPVSIESNRFDVGWRAVSLYGGELEWVDVLNNTYVGDLLYSKNVPPENYVVMGNTEVDRLADEYLRSLPPEWLHAARENWGGEGYTTQAVFNNDLPDPRVAEVRRELVETKQRIAELEAKRQVERAQDRAELEQTREKLQRTERELQGLMERLREALSDG